MTCLNKECRGGHYLLTSYMKIQSKKCLVNIGILRNAKEGWVNNTQGNLILGWKYCFISTADHLLFVNIKSFNLDKWPPDYVIHFEQSLLISNTFQLFYFWFLLLLKNYASSIEFYWRWLIRYFKQNVWQVASFEG